MPKKYNSFEEIDTRLEVLKLQREIDYESFKLNLYKAKRDILPRQFSKGISSILQKLAIAFVAKKLSKKLNKHQQREIIS